MWVSHGWRGTSSRRIAIDGHLLLLVALSTDAGDPGQGPEAEDEDDNGDDARLAQRVTFAAA